MTRRLEPDHFTTRESELLDAWDRSNVALHDEDVFEARLLAACGVEEVDEPSLRALVQRDEATRLQMAEDADRDYMAEVQGDATPQSMADAPRTTVPEWAQQALDNEVRQRLGQLVAVRGGASSVVNDTLDELRARLLSRAPDAPLGQALTDEESSPARRALTALALRICKRRLADELRRRWRTSLSAMHDGVATNPTHGARSASARIRELLRVVLDAVERLTPEDRELIAESIDIRQEARGAPPELANVAERTRLRVVHALLAAEIRSMAPAF